MSEGEKTRELSIRRESPSSLLQQTDRFFDEINSNVFNDWYWSFRRRNPLSLRVFEEEPIFRTPLVNIAEDENNFKIKAELPGLDKGDIEINVKEDTLEVKGELEEDKKEEKEGRLVRREYKSSKYYRAFKLPENIDDEKIDATLDKGMLIIDIPKRDPVETEKKSIEIK